MNVNKLIMKINKLNVNEEKKLSPDIHVFIYYN